MARSQSNYLKKTVKNARIDIRVTYEEKANLKEQADKLGMTLSIYVHDKVFNGNQRNHYAKRKVCQSLVRTSVIVDEMMDVLEGTEVDFIEKEKIIPLINKAKGELNTIWMH